ncbi:MAG: EAL domain-containing protein, partial [Anaerovorax sp.]
ERNGLISALDRYVWEAACKVIRKWLNMGVVPLPLTVNCSRVNAHNIHICDILKELLDKYALPASLIQLEITETAYMDDPVAMATAVINLQEAGFHVLMDDFGSGYSSLNILKDIAFDTLKLDMGFLEDSGNTSKGEVIFSSIVEMVKRLEIPVVAEGVETAHQVEFLKAISCDFAQGYYYYRPLPADEFEKKILKI